jgi:hypothetical protein
MFLSRRRTFRLDRGRVSRLFRQLDSIGVLPFSFVLLSQNFFEPLGLTLSRCFVHKCRIVKDHKFLTTMVTAQSAHLS